MSFRGEDIGTQPSAADENAPTPWESIELEEADREPAMPAAMLRATPQATRTAAVAGMGAITEMTVPATIEAEVRAPLRVAVQRPNAATFSAAATGALDSDSRGSRVLAPVQATMFQTVRGEDSGEGPDEAFDGPTRGGAWTIPLICFGIGLIACCTIIPQADANRRMAYQKELLRRDLESIQKQVAVNDEFLKRVYDDASLAERLAQRQMNVVPAGNRVWQDARGNDPQSMSPYGLTQVPKPEPLPPYQPTGGTFAALCREPRSNLYLTGVALMMLAAGLVMGGFVAQPPRR